MLVSLITKIRPFEIAGEPTIASGKAVVPSWSSSRISAPVALGLRMKNLPFSVPTYNFPSANTGDDF
jgi:hypothetical protein